LALRGSLRRKVNAIRNGDSSFHGSSMTGVIPEGNLVIPRRVYEPDPRRPDYRRSIAMALGVLPPRNELNDLSARGGVSVSSVACKAFTRRPQRNSVPSMLEALRHGGHRGRSAPQDFCCDNSLGWE
jgi:hypothetical protein